MWQPPPIGKKQWKDVYTMTEVAEMFGVRNSTVLRIAKSKKCGRGVGYYHYFSLEDIEKIYYSMSPNAQQRYNNQFKKP